MSIFWEISTLVSIMAILTVWEFPFLWTFFVNFQNFITATLTGLKRYLIVVSICISLVSHVEHFHTFAGNLHISKKKSLKSIWLISDQFLFFFSAELSDLFICFEYQFVVVVLTQGLSTSVLDSLCRLGWPWTHRYPPASVSQMLRLEVWNATPRSNVFKGFIFVYVHVSWGVHTCACKYQKRHWTSQSGNHRRLWATCGHWQPHWGLLKDHSVLTHWELFQPLDTKLLPDDIHPHSVDFLFLFIFLIKLTQFILKYTNQY